MKIFIKLFFRYFLITSIAFSFGFFINGSSSVLFNNLVENLLFAIVLIFPHFIIRNNQLNKWFFIVFYTIYTLTICFEMVFYSIYNTTFSSSVIFVILDTNLQETQEFLKFYLTSNILFFIAFLLITLIVVLVSLKPKWFITEPLSVKAKIVVTSIAFGIVLFLKLSQLIIYNLPYMAIRASVHYYIDSKKLSQYASDKIGNFNHISRSTQTTNKDQEIYVIIIGEATVRSHLGIYGYYRNTTPLLEEIENELLVYDSVISPDTYTIASLTKALTLGNYENASAKFNGSVIQLLNSANFKTFWISAQKPAGEDDSQVTNIGLGAQSSYFLNIKRAEETSIYDEVLVAKLEDVLKNDESKKKVIFIHTLGTHVDYKSRYPENFNVFNNDIPKTKFKKERVYNEINAYDNAVRYTDYIIRSVIEKVRALNSYSFVLYFSDHGEEVYDEIEFSGHFRDELKTKNVYEIPFMIWQSEGYKQLKSLNGEVNTKYMTDDLFHAIADLAGVKASEVDSTRSIFNPNFKERKRIVKDTVDYDDYFK